MSDYGDDDQDEKLVTGPSHLEVQLIKDDLTAACNGLGKIDINDGTYMKDRDCKSFLREIIRILNADTKEYTARIMLGQMNIVQSDLIPLMNQYCDYNEGDSDLFNLIMRLCTNLTASALLLFEHQEVPTDIESIKLYNQLQNGLYRYKDAFANDPNIWQTLNTHLRHTEDEIPFERLLILIRNILHIPIDSSADQGVKSGFDAHELCLYRMGQCGMFHTIIEVASETQRGMEFCFHIIEIVYLMLRDQNPVTVANASANPNKRKLTPDDADSQKLVELAEREKRDREVAKRRSAINPRFKHSAFMIQNLNSIGGRPVISSSLVTSRENFTFDNRKTSLRKSKNRKPLSSEANSAALSDRNTKTSKITYTLKVFSKLFVEKVYANYMQQIKHNLIQKKAAENDESYYLWSIQYFTCFNMQLHMSLDNISETMSTSSLHFIQILITDYQDKLKLEKKRPVIEKISKRLHLAIRAYRETICLIKSIKEGSDFWNTIETIKKNILTELEYNSLLLTLFQQYDSSKHCPEFLKDLIKTNHVFLDLMQDYTQNDERCLHFMTRYCAPDVLKSYLEALRDFRVNDAELNLNILKFYERVAHDCKRDVMLMQASLLKCLLDIHDYHESMPGHAGFIALTKHIMANFGEKIHKKRWMIQELLFWKNHDDLVEIEMAIDPPPPPSPGAPLNDSPLAQDDNEGEEELKDSDPPGPADGDTAWMDDDDDDGVNVNLDGDGGGDDDGVLKDDFAWLDDSDDESLDDSVASLGDANTSPRGGVASPGEVGESTHADAAPLRDPSASPPDDHPRPTDGNESPDEVDPRQDNDDENAEARDGGGDGNAYSSQTASQLELDLSSLPVPD